MHRGGPVSWVDPFHQKHKRNKAGKKNRQQLEAIEVSQHRRLALDLAIQQTVRLFSGLDRSARVHGDHSSADTRTDRTDVAVNLRVIGGCAGGKFAPDKEPDRRGYDQYDSNSRPRTISCVSAARRGPAWPPAPP